VVEDHKSEGLVVDRYRVLPCVSSAVHANRFAALRASREFDLLPVAPPSTLLFRAQSDNPDVIVIADGETFLARAGNRRALEEVFSDIPAVLLTADPNAVVVRSAARIKIYSVIPLEATAHQLVTAMTASIAGFAVTVPRPPATPANAMRIAEELTAREVEVLRWMARGHTNKQLAAQLNISEHTAKFHVSSVLAKLGAQTRTEAVTIGMTRGLVAI
jgi:DNA-binding NarL/FixJ family response regulator